MYFDPSEFRASDNFKPVGTTETKKKFSNSFFNCSLNKACIPNLGSLEKYVEWLVENPTLVISLGQVQLFQADQ